uniref:Uncharacterized protein n=1 Tax=Anguilla anguilla TaxID=7936 RepID=A0A0E9QQW2_ANGAN
MVKYTKVFLGFNKSKKNQCVSIVVNLNSTFFQDWYAILIQFWGRSNK